MVVSYAKGWHYHPSHPLYSTETSYSSKVDCLFNFVKGISVLFLFYLLSYLLRYLLKYLQKDRNYLQKENGKKLLTYLQEKNNYLQKKNSFY